MNEKTIVGVIMVIAIGVILVGTLLVPSLNTYSDAEMTIENTGANYSLYETGDTHTITFTTDSMITDGVAQPLPDRSLYGSATVVYGNGIFRIHNDGNLRYWGILGSGDVNRSLGVATAVTITIDETGTATATSTDTSITSRNFSGTVMFAEPNGEYALSHNPYVVKDSPIYGCGNTVIDETTYTLSWTGTTEGITTSWVYPPEQEIGTIAINTTDVQTNLMKIDSIVIPIESAEGEATYTYFFAPKEIAYENPEYIGGNYASLLLVIPVLIITSFIVIGVRMFASNRE